MEFRVIGRVLVAVLLVAGSALRGQDSSLVRESGPLTPEEELQGLHVPEGFEIRLFAAEPMINKPINLACDERGRIWVSSTVEYPYAAAKERWVDAQGSRVRESRDAIKILEDTDGDGRADKATDFADGLNIPTGVVPWHKPEHKDGCIAWSIPNIWYFADTDGDGTCDLREVLFGPLGYEKDTHGMLSSFRFKDGWIYATHGFNNTSTLTARDGSTLEMHSGNVFRFRPDGSHVEIWSRGQVNPFGLAFDRRGNLYSADCHSAPVYQLLRGAWYPSFGKPHDGMGFGPTMIEHTHGSTGICGLTYLDRSIWGAEWNDHLLIGNPVTSRVNHDLITFTGTTPKANEKPDFVVSDDLWFRPVDLCLGGDGALYIADFYNKIIGHYEVPLTHEGRDRERGRIWKVVRTAGVHARSPFEEPGGRSVADLADPSPFVRRAAAEHFQFQPRLEALAPLLRALGEVEEGDTHLRHALRLAIRAQLALPGGFAQVPNNPSGAIADICLAVHSPDAAGYLVRGLQGGVPMDAAAWSHIGRHAGGGNLAAALAVARTGDPRAQVDRLEAIVRGMEEGGVVQPPAALLDWGQQLARMLLRAEGGEDAAWIAQAHPDDAESASPWVLQPRRCNDGTEVEVLSSLRLGEDKVEERTGVLRSREFAAPERMTFWICGHRGPPDQPAHERNEVRLVDAQSGGRLASAFPPRSDECVPVEWDLKAASGRMVRLEIVDGDRGEAYAWLGVTRFDPPVVKVAEFAASAARTEALQTLAALLKVTAPADLRDQLRAYLPPAPAAPPVAPSPEERKRLDDLIAARMADHVGRPADAAAGAKVFGTHCAVCHQIGGEGGLVGPQLDGIGQRGVARLCEDILDPNKNVDAHFLLTTVTMMDGSAAAGLLRGESGAVVVLTDLAGVDHRLVKSEIAARETLPLSLMPAGFGERIAPGEFSALLSYLLDQKAR